MVERVARAVADEVRRQRIAPEIWSAVFGEEIPPTDMGAVARAAIAAMREPTQAQYEALSATNKMWRELDSRTVWQIYIDAALQPDAVS